jgi:undecaprenyl pyrophosphate synthase
LLLTGRIPRHVGIIMDGNGRWAELRGLPRIEGHRRGAERSKEIIEVSCLFYRKLAEAFIRGNDPDETARILFK